ncbi:rhodanese-like domain-containing protein [Wenyingzhuangia sp. chi5]|uniref:Rhodanese-like domain-containing protein n=2 Tax=Wenyingzhuangia gilva TaxID=3057677 RepID=A0ABT8VU53_9FLAO|nr:rhodanese-like domain-containing protein [Wenyingzhuangia sp. chi5]
MRMILNILIVAILGWFVFNFIGNQKLKGNRLEVADFNEAIQVKNVQLIDVRTPSEFKSGHIKGAKNIDVFSSEFKQKINELDKSKATYIYCRSGQRSQKALKIMLKEDFENIHDLKGGYMTWKSNQN